MNLDQIPAYVLALAWIVGVLVSALKGGIEALVPAQNRWHDLLFTLLPVVLSVAAMLGYVLTHGGDRFMAVIWGVLSGCGAIGAYTVHTRTRSPATDAVVLQGLSISTTPPWVPTPAAGAPPPAPPQTPAEAPAAAPSAPAAAWSSTTVSYAPPAAPAGPAVDTSATPPEPPGEQTPTEAPAGPSVTYSSGPPTP